MGGLAGVGACSAERVGGPAGSAGRLGVDGRSYDPSPGPVPPRPIPTQTFRVAGVCILPIFTYTIFSGGRGLHFTYTNDFRQKHGGDVTQNDDFQKNGFAGYTICST